MKKFLISFLLLFLLGLYIPFASFAQEATPIPTEEPFNFERARKDYIYNMEIYKKAYANYQLARSEYLQAKTLISQNKAKEATLEMLKARDEVVITYLTMLRMKLAEVRGISDTVRDGFYARIDTEVSWHLKHKDILTSAATLEDLFADSDEAKIRFPLTEGVTYEILSEIMFAKASLVRESAKSVFDELKQFVSEVRQSGKKDTSVIERWILAVENKFTRSDDKEMEARNIAIRLSKAPSSQRLNLYYEERFRLEESLQYLKEAQNYMKEIVKEIKTAD